MFTIRSKLLKFVLIAFAALCLFCGIFLLFVPTILSTNWGNAQLLSTLNSRIPGKVEASDFSLSWFNGQKIHGLKLFDPHGQMVLSIDTLETKTPLYTLLSNSRFSNATEVKGLDVNITETKDGLTNLEKSLGVVFSDIKLPEGKTLRLSDANVLLTGLHSKNGGVFKSQGRTEYKGILGKFDVDASWNNQEASVSAYLKNFPVKAAAPFLQEKQPLAALLLPHLFGDAVNLTLTGESKRGNSSWKTEIGSGSFQLTAAGTVEKGILHLTSPLKANFTLTQEALTTLSNSISEFDKWQILKPSNVRFEVSRLSFPLAFVKGKKGTSLHEPIVLKGLLSIPDAAFVNLEDRYEKAQFKSLQLKLDTPDRSKKLTLVGTGSYFYESIPVDFRLNATFRMPEHLSTFRKSIYHPSEILFSLENVSTRLLDRVLGTKNLAFDAFGKKLTFQLQSPAKDPRALEMKLVSDKIDIPSILFSTDGDVSRINNGPLSGNFEIEKIIFKEKGKDPSIVSLSIPWKVEAGFRRLQLKFNGSTSMGKQEKGELSGNLTADSFESLKDASFHFSLKGVRIPSSFLELISQRKEFTPLFGPSIDLDLSFAIDHLKGNIFADLSGSNGKAFIDAFLANHAITLNKPLEISTYGTAELGKAVLSRLTPIFNEMRSSEDRIKLTVYPEHFYLPIDPLVIREVQVGKAVLEMGKITFSNSGDVRSLLSLIRPAHTNSITVWTTPLYVMVKNGVLNINRVDMLIMNKYPIAAWGKIDLSNDRINMIVGVSAAALSQAMDIGNLDSSTMVQVPITGTLSKTKVDTSKAAAKIGALVAQKSGGPEGLIIGTVLELARGKDSKIPPPTTSPLPWAGMDFSGDETATDYNKNSQESKNPIKGIQKEASKLIKGLFR